MTPLTEGDRPNEYKTQRTAIILRSSNSLSNTIITNYR